MDGPASRTSFLVLSVSIIGILTTSLLLLGYYLFVTKCGLGWRPQDVATGGQAQPPHLIGPSLPLYSTAADVRGLAEAAIRQIPTFRYKKGVCAAAAGQRSAQECAVCLSEFQEEERVRLLPGCLHVFHIDCIDTWLQGNANCPLCRLAISADQLDMSILHDHAGQERRRGDAVIQVSDTGDHGHDHELSGRKVHNIKICSMGDECIDEGKGEREELFSVQQPMRRSLSMDSCRDKQFYLALQKILQQQQQQDSTVVGEDGKGEGSGGGRSARLRRSFFSFTQGRSSRSAILPM